MAPNTPNSRPKCTATTRAGGRCTRNARKGSKYCGTHGKLAGELEGRIGARPKLSKAVADHIIASVRGGAYEGQAARAAGVHPTTLSRWKETGEADLENDTGSPHRYLYEGLLRAGAMAENEMVGVLRNAALGYEYTEPVINPRTGQPVMRTNADGEEVPVERIVKVLPDPRSATEFLKRKHPERWGTRTQVAVEGSLTSGEPRSVVPHDSDREALLRELAAIASDQPVREDDE